MRKGTEEVSWLLFSLFNPQILFTEVPTILLEREALEDESDHVDRRHVEENQSTPAVPTIPAETPDMWLRPQWTFQSSLATSWMQLHKWAQARPEKKTPTIPTESWKFVTL